MDQPNDTCSRGELSPLIVNSIIDSMALGLMIVDPKGHIVVANQVIASILGISRAKLLCQGWGQLFIDSDSNIEFNQVFIDVIWNEIQDLQRRVPYYRPDGEKRTLNVTTSFLKHQGEMQGIILLMEDVTEAIRMHEREKRILNAVNRLQAERNEGLNKLALSVAHQIRNPMMTIGGFSSMMLKTEGRSEQDKEHLGIIREELLKLERVVKAVVEYASLNEVKKTEVSLDDLVHKAVEELRDRAQHENIHLHVRLSCTSCEVLGDKEMLPRAVEELLANSLEAGGLAGAVDVTLEYRDNNARLSVQDQGEGIKEEFLPFVFDPFFTTRSHKVGMGLSLAKRIVQEHQGSIFIESETGQGTTVTMILPRE